jgi:threonine dehydratase
MIGIADVLAAARRIAPHLPPTPLHRHPLLDEALGAEIYVKHEDAQPTGSFKARNALAAATLLDEAARARGLVAASRGNHGQGLAWAGRVLGAPVTICVPVGNNRGKNAAMRAWGATVVEEGADYDEATRTAARLVEERGMTLVHSTNDRGVIAGAGTIALEVLTAQPALDALVVAVGGGSQAVGALTVARALRPGMPVYGVQAAGAPAIHDAWHARRRGEPPPPLSSAPPRTIADGLATRQTYAMTFDALAALEDFVTVSDEELADAVRLIFDATHHVAEPAGAAGVAGVRRLGDRLRGRRVGVVLSGCHIEAELLSHILG